MSEFKVFNLKKKYKSHTVVQDVSLSVNSGEVVGLLGPNGAGKTTCFYMMVGLVDADSVSNSSSFSLRLTLLASVISRIE